MSSEPINLLNDLKFGETGFLSISRGLDVVLLVGILGFAIDVMYGLVLFAGIIWRRFGYVC